MSDELPDRVRQRVEAEEARERASEEQYRKDMRFLEKAGLREPEPEPASPQAAFTRRLAEQRREEEAHEARVNRAMHEDPSPPVADPLRELYRAQQRDKVWGRRRRWR